MYKLVKNLFKKCVLALLVAAMLTTMVTNQEVLANHDVAIDDTFEELAYDSVTLGNATNMGIALMALTDEIDTQEDNTICNDVLYIEDSKPWGYDSNETILKALHQSYDKVRIKEAQNMNLSGYRVIILANSQSQTFYNELAKMQNAIEAYLTNGGTMVYGICYSQSGIKVPYIPGGIKSQWDTQSHNLVADAEHPIVTGNNSDQTPITNANLVNNYASHISFDQDTFLEGTHVILTTPKGEATLIEYPFGKGTVIVSGLTWEFSYKNHQNNAKSYGEIALDDLYLYAMYCSQKSLGADGTVSSEITLSKDSGVNGDEISIHVASTLSSFRRTAVRVAYIADADDNIVDVLDPETRVALIAGNPDEVDLQWLVSDSLMAGDYKVVVKWFDDEEELLGEAEKAFTIIPNGGLTNEITSVKDAYTTAEMALFSCKVINESTNSCQKDLSVVTEIQNEEGLIIAENEHVINQMSPTEELLFEEQFALEDYAAGNYTAVSKVIQNGEIASTAEMVIVVSLEEIKLSGELTTTPAEDQEELVMYQGFISNASRRIIQDLPMKLTTISLASTEVVAKSESLIYLEKSGKYSFAEETYTESLEPGDYQVILSCVVDENEMILASSSFTVAERTPSYFLSGYSLFANGGNVEINCNTTVTDGDVYAENDLKLCGSIIQMNGICAAGNSISKAGWIVNVDRAQENCEEAHLNHYSPEIQKNMLKLDGYQEVDTYVLQDLVSQPTKCNTMVDMYQTNIHVDNYLVAEGKLGFHANELHIGGDTETVICSEADDILIEATTVNIHGFVYAPNGTVTIRANQLNLVGTIVAKEIKIQGTEIRLQK